MSYEDLNRNHQAVTIVVAIIILVFLFLFFSAPTNGQEVPVIDVEVPEPVLRYAALELFPWSNNGTDNAEYALEWVLAKDFRWGTLSGFGFYEGRNGPASWYASQGLDYTPPKGPFFVATEYSRVSGENWTQAGPALDAGKVPLVKRGVGRFFEFLTIAPMFRIHGDGGQDREVRIVWETKHASLGSVELWFEGFYRFLRPDGQDGYGQPQVWLRFNRAPSWRYGAEFEVVGSDITPLFGAKVTLK